MSTGLRCPYRSVPLRPYLNVHVKTCVLAEYLQVIPSEVISVARLEGYPDDRCWGAARSTAKRTSDPVPLTSHSRITSLWSQEYKADLLKHSAAIATAEECEIEQWVIWASKFPRSLTSQLANTQQALCIEHGGKWPLLVWQALWGIRLDDVTTSITSLH